MKETPQSRYHKKNLKQYRIGCMRTTEQDIINWLDDKPNCAGYIKALIRNDMKENRKMKQQYEIRRFTATTKKGENGAEAFHNQFDQDTELVKAFDTYEEAKAFYDDYPVSCSYDSYHRNYTHEGKCIQFAAYDEDGEIIDIIDGKMSGDIYDEEVADRSLDTYGFAFEPDGGDLEDIPTEEALALCPTLKEDVKRYYQIAVKGGTLHVIG